MEEEVETGVAVGLFKKVDGDPEGDESENEEESSTILQTFDEENYHNVGNAEDAIIRYNDLKKRKIK